MAVLACCVVTRAYAVALYWIKFHFRLAVYAPHKRFGLLDSTRLEKHELKTVNVTRVRGISDLRFVIGVINVLC